jgi:hypothetical protein
MKFTVPNIIAYSTVHVYNNLEGLYKDDNDAILAFSRKRLRQIKTGIEMSRLTSVRSNRKAFYGSKDSYCGHLGYDTVYSGKWTSKFRRNLRLLLPVLKMDAVCSSETLVSTTHSTIHHNSDDRREYDSYR